MTVSFAELRTRPQFSVETLAHAMATGEISAHRLVEGCLEALVAARPLNAVVALEAEEALAQAHACDRERAAGHRRGPLHGIPLAHKDMFYRTGKVSACGSIIRRDAVQTSTSPLLQALTDAGAITLGRLHMAEFALGATGHNAHLGRCRNPWDTDLITGGSSSGSGVVVGGRLLPAALGSDTGGSLRLPAAFCGAATLKPGQYLLSTEAMMGLSESLDTPGAIGRSARDLAMLMTILHPEGPDYLREVDRKDADLTIGVPRQYYTEGLDREVEEAFSAACATFRHLGATIVDVDTPGQEHLGELANLVWAPEAAALHLDWLRSRPQDYGEQVRTRLLQGVALPATSYIRARQHRSLALRRLLGGALSRCDVLLTPATRTITPTNARADVGAGKQMAPVIAELSALTRTISFLGLPAFVTPMGFDARGAPLGLQIIGRPRSETQLLRTGNAYETATRWLERLPPPL